jgi:hypothetical protein
MSADLIFSVDHKASILTVLQQQLNTLYFTPELLPLFKGVFTAVEGLSDLTFASLKAGYAISQNGLNGSDGCEGSRGKSSHHKGSTGGDGECGQDGSSAGTILVSLVSIPHTMMYALTHPTLGTRFIRLNEQSTLKFSARGGDGGDGGRGGRGGDGLE